MDEYEIEDPTEQFWWDGVKGEEEDPEVYDVFEQAGVSPVRGGAEGFIPSNQAFTIKEYEALIDTVSEQYSGTLDEFVEDVAESDIHPQQSKQLERMVENPTHKPEGFSNYDGFPEYEG